MDKIFDHSKLEDKIYAFWENKEIFKAKVDSKKKPFSIILPPPNANGRLHMGHAMFVYEDLMIRFNKMNGMETLWLPGFDHAGIETQFVFEKQLKKKGKSRFDYQRDDLYKAIFEFTQENMPNIKSQLRRLGFALDWSREKFTMDEDIVNIVYETFKKLYDKDLLYRDKKLVNYCIKDGTSFSDLEVEDKEIVGKLYFVKFPLEVGGFITVATTRPETILGDAAVAVNPKDKKYKDLIGKLVILPITNRKVPIIADDMVDMKFGTGAVKITPSHDFEDFETAKRHGIKFPAVIGFDGKIIGTNTEFDNLRIFSARERIIKKLNDMGLIEKVKDHTMVQKICYKCGSVLEPLPLKQWFIRTKPLVKNALKLIEDNKIDIKPKRFKKTLVQILENFIDWNISRQIVWGIRIPAWKCTFPESNKKMGFHEDVVPQVFKGKTKTYRIRDHKLKVGDKVAFENSHKHEIFGYGSITNIRKVVIGDIDLQDKTHFAVYDSYEDLIKAFKKHSPQEDITKKTNAFLYEYAFEDIKDSGLGCGKWIVDIKKPAICTNCGSSNLIQDTDTFDTWFSSSQWPFATLKTQGKDFYNYFYPTTVMETGYEILRAWVARMIMLGFFVTEKQQFNTIYLHGMVRDGKGQKMSKSKGNVIDPLEKIDKYGADAVRASLIFNTKEGADISLSDAKIQGMRNFANKVWNIGRFIHMNLQTR
ncbi:MAG: class I tRNA ligase family protein, partial [Patescibacteria group bacterium]